MRTHFSTPRAPESTSHTRYGHRHRIQVLLSLIAAWVLSGVLYVSCAGVTVYAAVVAADKASTRAERIRQAQQERLRTTAEPTHPELTLPPPLATRVASVIPQGASAPSQSGDGSGPPDGAGTGQTTTYRVIPDHGSALVRTTPSAQASLVQRLVPGTEVACERIETGAYAYGTDQWAYCSEVGGYISMIVLARADGTAPVTVPSIGTSYRVVETASGVVAVHAEPSAESPILTRLMSGAAITCTATVTGQPMLGTDQWIHCPDTGGYVLSVFLGPEP